MMAEISDKSVDRSMVWLRRVARISSGLIIGITLVVLVGHIIEPEPVEVDYPPIENLLPVIMCLSVLGLGIAWRWEGLGGGISVVFFLIHLVVYWAIRQRFFPLRALLIFSPVPITGILSLIYWWRSRISQNVN
jgi:hypothetical protein